MAGIPPPAPTLLTNKIHSLSDAFLSIMLAIFVLVLLMLTVLLPLWLSLILSRLHKTPP
jgi:hypothetical protein